MTKVSNLESNKLVHVKIEYDDQNETFKSELPVEGVVLQIVNGAGSKNWSLVKLEKEVNWDTKKYPYLLISSRWEGYELNQKKAVSVFILLADDPNLDMKKIPGDFTHVAWGMAKYIKKSV